jgi:hypothetical protein
MRTLSALALVLFTVVGISAQAQKIDTVTTVVDVWTNPGQPEYQFAKIQHPDQNGFTIVVCETKRKDCKPLTVGKTYPAAMIDNDTSKAYTYHKKIEQIFLHDGLVCTDVVYRTLVIVTDEMGDLMRENSPAIGHTKIPVYYAMLARPTPDIPCRPIAAKAKQ